MNCLFESFPETVKVSGKHYRIVTDFREWIKLSEFLKNVDQITLQVCQMILDWYIDPPPNDVAQAIHALQNFMTADEMYPFCNETDENTEIEEESHQEKQAFSFNQDAGCIYSAFLEVYGIDVETVPYLHWWKFKLLFDNLPSNTEIKERIYYRTVNLNEIKDKQERDRIEKIRKRIAIRDRKKKVLSDFEIGDAFA